MSDEMSQIGHELTLLEQTMLLEPKHFELIRVLKLVLDTYRIQLDLYIDELQQFTGQKSKSLLGVLTIKEHSFPSTVKKGKSTSPIEVQLLTGARTNAKVLSPVSSEIVKGATLRAKGKSKRTVELENNQENLINSVARFSRLSFTNGTYVTTVHLKFSIMIEALVEPGQMVKHKLETKPTEPIIVMTHNDQWHVARGTLLESQFFKGKTSIPIFLFCNYLQLCYLEATRQNPSGQRRPLTFSEMEYLCDSKFKKRVTVDGTITQKEFGEFWSWFGPYLQKLRYQKHLQPMWISGLLWGLISKNTAETILMQQPPGTFLIRFSERHKGGIAVAYRWSDSGDKPVRHYLVRPSDTADGRTFPEFLKESSTFVRILQMYYDRNGQQLAVLKDKDQALMQFYKKKNDEGDGTGYDKELLALESLKSLTIH
eukprot:TRINITY_DN5234_c0_g1_i1.p1 TRINITY_DN5234_c0_g1~~TRINITY_DN5234_c0_g1_i1.p1  ORF type:complete len:469 (+),score=64.69 TRINITY_DN5234_c0_g1_i1:127-1407(+)